MKDSSSIPDKDTKVFESCGTNGRADEFSKNTAYRGKKTSAAIFWSIAVVAAAAAVISYFSYTDACAEFKKAEKTYNENVSILKQHIYDNGKKEQELEKLNSDIDTLRSQLGEKE